MGDIAHTRQRRRHSHLPSVFKNQAASIADRVVVRAVFTDPVFTAVALTETPARADGYVVAIGTQPFTGSP